MPSTAAAHSRTRSRVCRSGERVLHHGVHGNEGDAIGQRHQPVSQAAAIDLHGRMLAPEDRDVLVHDAAGHAHEIAFRALAEFGQLQRVELAAAQQGEGGGDFERRGGTESGAVRHGAADQQIRALKGNAGAHEFPRHADGVIGPLASGLQAAEGRDVELALFAAAFRIDAQFAVRRKARRRRRWPARAPRAAQSRGCNRCARRSG